MTYLEVMLKRRWKSFSVRLTSDPEAASKDKELMSFETSSSLICLNDQTRFAVNSSRVATFRSSRQYSHTGQAPYRRSRSKWSSPPSISADWRSSHRGSSTPLSLPSSAQEMTTMETSPRRRCMIGQCALAKYLRRRWGALFFVAIWCRFPIIGSFRGLGEEVDRVSPGSVEVSEWQM